MPRKVYLRPVVQPRQRPEYEHRTVHAKVHGCIPTGWQVHHVDHNHGNNDPVNLIALPRPIHKFIHTRRLHPSRPACAAAVVWWRLTHPATRKRQLSVKVAAIFREYRRAEAEAGRAQRIAAYVAAQLQDP